MKALTDLFERLGFSSVKNYIQSGNIIFNYDKNTYESEISMKIEKAIRSEFKLNISVLVRSLDEMENIHLRNPFLNEEYFDPSKMAVIFLAEVPLTSELQNLKNIDYPPDKFKVSGREIFLYCPNGFGRSKLYTNFFEKKIGVTGTSRNWKTINTILKMAMEL